MTIKVPIYEQLEELEEQFGRMHRSYPGLISRQLMRRSVAELHLERMAAAVETLAWLVAHRETLLSYIEYTKRTGLDAAAGGNESPCVFDDDHAEVEAATEEETA